jgi:hypothetical protein
MKGSAMSDDPKYEAFCDTAYFDMWCVRRIGDRTFGQGFHVLNKESADALMAELEALQSALAQAEAERDAAYGRAAITCESFTFDAADDIAAAIRALKENSHAE